MDVIAEQEAEWQRFANQYRHKGGGGGYASGGAAAAAAAPVAANVGRQDAGGKG